MTSFVNWYKINKNALKYLFVELKNTCSSYGIILRKNKNTFDNFLLMMYHESNKDIINKDLYPEFFNTKLNSTGYQEYLILD